MPPKKKRLAPTLLSAPPAIPDHMFSTKGKSKTKGEVTEQSLLGSLEKRILDGTLKKAGKAMQFDPKKRESKKQAKALKKLDRKDEKNQAKKFGSIPVDSDLAPVYVDGNNAKKTKKKAKKTKTPADWKQRVTIAEVRAAIKAHNEKYSVTNRVGSKYVLIRRLEEKTKKIKKTGR